MRRIGVEERRARLAIRHHLARQTAGAVRDAAERLAVWVGRVRVTPRFRTPLERELAG